MMSHFSSLSAGCPSACPQRAAERRKKHAYWVPSRAYAPINRGKVPVPKQRCSGNLSDSLWEVARKQVFCPDDLINLFLVDFRGDLCQRENQHPSCGRDGVGEKFMT